MIVLTPIDHRNDPRLLPPYEQKPMAYDSCQACTIALQLQWEHPFGKYEPGKLYGHSRGCLVRHGIEFRLQKGNNYLDICYGAQVVGTTPEWKYPTGAPNARTKPLPDGVRQGATKGVIKAVTEITDVESLPTWLGTMGKIIGARIPWYSEFRDPGMDGIVRSAYSQEDETNHYVAIVGLVPKGRRNTLHYVFSPHRGTGYGDHGYGYINKYWLENMEHLCSFYVLN